MRIILIFIMILGTSWSLNINASNICEAALLSEGPLALLTRELRLTPELREFAEQNAEDSDLVNSLTRIFTVLNPETLHALARRIVENQTEESTSEFALHSFFAKHPEFLNQNLIENYVILKSLIGGDLLSEFDFGILSYLLREIPKSPRPEFVDISDHYARHARMRVRLKELLRINIYQHAIEEMLRSHDSRTQFLGLMNTRRSLQSYPQRILSENDLDKLVKKVAAGNMNEKSLYLVKIYLGDLTYRILKHSNQIGRMLVNNPSEDLIERRRFFEIFEDYYAQKMQIKSSLSDIKDLYDYLEFGSPLPLSVEVLKANLYSEARKLLFPLKNRFAEAVAFKARQTQFQKNPSTSPITYVDKDFFVPPPARHKPPRENVVAQLKPENEKTIEERIPFERALRPFTRAANSLPQNLNLLNADTVYEFWFLRDAEPTLEKVRFASDVLRFLCQRPSEGLQFLTALHYGYARENRQSGLKELFSKSRKYPGRIFELKIKSHLRGLLLMNEGEWHFVKVTDKDDIDSDVRWIMPLKM